MRKKLNETIQSALNQIEAFRLKNPGSGSRELSLVITKLEEAQLWLTKVEIEKD